VEDVLSRKLAERERTVEDQHKMIQSLEKRIEVLQRQRIHPRSISPAAAEVPEIPETIQSDQTVESRKRVTTYLRAAPRKHAIQGLSTTGRTNIRSRSPMRVSAHHNRDATTEPATSDAVGQTKKPTLTTRRSVQLLQRIDNPESTAKLQKLVSECKQYV